MYSQRNEEQHGDSKENSNKCAPDSSVLISSRAVQKQVAMFGLRIRQNLKFTDREYLY